MQAIILAAGMGKRLGKLTQSNTKCMIEVNGVKLIERLLCQLEAFGITNIVIVVGYQAEKLKDYIGGLGLKSNVTYVENSIFDTTNNIYSLYLAKEFLLSGDTLLFESDLIFEDSLLENILAHPYPNIALVSKFESWMDGTVVQLSDERTIKKFITKDSFVFEDIPSYYKTVNIYKFSRGFSESRYVPFLEAYCKALGHNEYYEQVLKVIALLDKPDIIALDIGTANWYEIDDIQDLDIAASMFDHPSGKLQKMQQRYGGYWRYPKILDFCYLVNPYFPNSKLLSEIKANFERLIREYPSGLKVNNLLAGKYFDVSTGFICVGNGATELINALTQQMRGSVGVVFPTFEEYPNRLESEQIVAYIPSGSDFCYSAGDLITFYSAQQLSWLLLVNPDNPSGNFIPLGGVLALLHWAKENAINVVLDESFVDFSEGFETNSMLSDAVLKEYPNLIVVKSISKSYGVPGLRLGIIATSNQSILSRLKHDVSIWNINSFAEFYLQIYGKYQSDYNTSCRFFAVERDRFYYLLSQISYLRVIPSSANYFLCEVLPPFTSHELTKTLLDHFNILIKDCAGKKGFEARPNFVRIAIRNTCDNDFMIESLKRLLQ